MTICTAFYLTLDKERRLALGRNGWDAYDWSRLYADLHMPFQKTVDETAILQALDFGLYAPAARLKGSPDEAEEVWATLQNHEAPWVKRNDVTALTDMPRSMMTGDVLAFEDGTAVIALAIGFGPVGPMAEQRFATMTKSL